MEFPPSKIAQSRCPQLLISSIFLIGISSSLLGCKKPEAKVEVRPKLPPAAMTTSDEGIQQDKVCHQAIALLEKRDFAALDKRAHELRAEKGLFPNGASAIRSLYGGIETINDDAPDPQWDALIGVFNDWIKERPDSITPRVALVETFVNFAWKARGNGYADTITEEGGKLFEQRLAMAHNANRSAQS